MTIRYDIPAHQNEPDEFRDSANREIERQMREWCAKKNEGDHRKRPGGTLCIDCGMDLDD